MNVVAAVQAARANDLGELRRLLNSDGSLLGATDGSDPLLVIAAQQDHLPIVHCLLERGAHVDGKGRNGLTALNWACFFRHVGIAELLLNRGADPTYHGQGRWTQLMYAASMRHMDILRLLLSYDAPNIDEWNREGKTALALACKYGGKEGAALLLKAGADPAAAADEPNTPLHLAKENKRNACVRLLEVSGLCVGIPSYCSRSR